MVFDIEKFSRLCSEDRVLSEHDGDSIGTYSEKRLHRILKRYITDDAECYEVKIGNHIADVAEENVISEIQTASFAPLAKKVAYYLEKTDYSVRIVCPVISKKTIIKANKETGEITSCKLSPKHEGDLDVLAKMYPLAECVGDTHFSLCVLHVNAEEYRYSEARRYNKKGRYDKDLFPTELVGISEFRSLSDYTRLFPTELCDGEFTVKEFSALTGLKKRKPYLALKFFVLCGFLRMEKRGKTNIYAKK